MSETIVVAAPRERKSALALAAEVTRAGSKATAPDFSVHWREANWRPIRDAIPTAAFVVFLIGPDAEQDSTLVNLVWQMAPMAQEPSGRFIFVSLDKQVASHENIAPFLKRHFTINGTDGQTIADHVKTHRAVLRAVVEQQRKKLKAENGAAGHVASIGPVRLFLGTALGLLGAFFWLDAFDDHLGLAPQFTRLLEWWRSFFHGTASPFAWLEQFVYLHIDPTPYSWVYDYVWLSLLLVLSLVIVATPTIGLGFVNHLWDGGFLHVQQNDIRRGSVAQKVLSAIYFFLKVLALPAMVTVVWLLVLLFCLSLLPHEIAESIRRRKASHILKMSYLCYGSIAYFGLIVLANWLFQLVSVARA